MLGCKCFHWNSISEFSALDFDHFSPPSPVPSWPQGEGFASGIVSLGEIEVFQVTSFEFIWAYNMKPDKKKGVSFFKPIDIPDGFHILGHYCQSNNHPLRGFVLVAREVDCFLPESGPGKLPALIQPLDYTLVWSPNDGSDEMLNGFGYFWLPQAPDGYKALGYLVTNKPATPELDEVRCVRLDITDRCEPYGLILDVSFKFPSLPFRLWSVRPCHRGMQGKGVSVGTFFCSCFWNMGEELSIACLKNLDCALGAMPNLDQIHTLIKHYGPTLFFHPEEVYLPSSVSWFFNNGSMLYKKGVLGGEAIDAWGSNLPGGGSNDGEFWIDLPHDDYQRNFVKKGDLKSAKLYVHVKPALGGTFTDLALWVFCPFNGPATLKIGIMNIAFGKVGEHVGDWEHFTLRVSNFTGELWSIYFSQHSGGEWVDAYDLEYIDGSKAIVYSSRNGHASFPHPGTYIQGSSKLGIGIRNDVARSKFFVNSSVSYEIVAAEYLGNAVIEPNWLQFMRKWGPTVVYDSRTELDKIINALPLRIRYAVENVFNKFPVELYGEDGPTGPKEKNNWVGDERSQ